ncbi:hypothetical protein R1flu_019488 [Riccia fluitans]|uniref:Uncharacterized protein n=1 Tax=Riccia fluitans TaxID=41844 RepID=A0ABD1ZIT1_9MARC
MYIKEEQNPMWEDRYKEALDHLEEKAQLLGLTHHECQKMIDIFESWVNPDDDQKLVPLVGKLDEVNYNPDIELRPLDELQDNYQSLQMDDEDYTRKMSMVERAELRKGIATNCPTTRSSVKTMVMVMLMKTKMKTKSLLMILR